MQYIRCCYPTIRNHRHYQASYDYQSDINNAAGMPVDQMTSCAIKPGPQSSITRGWLFSHGILAVIVGVLFAFGCLTLAPISALAVDKQSAAGDTGMKAAGVGKEKGKKTTAAKAQTQVQAQTEPTQPSKPATKPTKPAEPDTAKPQTAPAASSQTDAQYRAKVQQSIDKALEWMKAQQSQENGSYGNYPGVTAMALLAFSRSPGRYTDKSGPYISKASAWLASLAKPDGSIYDENLANYNTTLSIMALNEVGGGKYAEQVKKGQGYLVWLQNDEDRGFDKDNPNYGGIGYGGGGPDRPDLSNLHFSLEALATTGFVDDQQVFDKALLFIQRCQNSSETNDQKWAGDDGGFVYRPGESKTGGTASYGSMTYAGLKSLMYAQVDRNDPRVQDVWKWIRNNWSVSGNPGAGDMGLYFYWQTFAQALAVWGEPVIEDARDTRHDWFKEMADEIIKRQDSEGFWVNSNPRFWEDNKILATARAVLALSYGMDRSVVMPNATVKKPDGAGTGTGTDNDKDKGTGEGQGKNKSKSKSKSKDKGQE